MGKVVALGKAPAQSQSLPRPTEAAPTLTLIRAPTLRVGTPNSLDNPIKEATLRNQADLGIRVVTPSSRVEEATSIQHGAPHTEEAMVVMVVIQVDTSTKTQTTKS